MISTDALQVGFLSPSLLTIVNKGSSLKIVNEGLLMIVNETKRRFHIKTIV